MNLEYFETAQLTQQRFKKSLKRCRNVIKTFLKTLL